MYENELKQTIKELTAKGKGILAADESVKTATKRLEGIGVESSAETRRQYRQVVLAAPEMEKYISGVILYEETLHQKADDGSLFPIHLSKKGVVPGIKVDEGLAPFNGTEEEYTKGLETLPARLREFKKLGCRFAKWRAVYKITKNTPSKELIKKNSEDLAKYAKICNAEGFIPIVEPEILLEGDHSIERSEEVSRLVLKGLYAALKKENVNLSYTILKPSMVISGKEAKNRANVTEVAKRTLNVLKECVPKEVPSINFLSGGQTPKEATIHLNEMHKLDKHLPWNLSFSYARALQEPALSAWKGANKNIPTAQKAFVHRCMLNSKAVLGTYDQNLEN